MTQETLKLKITADTNCFNGKASSNAPPSVHTHHNLEQTHANMAAIGAIQKILGITLESQNLPTEHVRGDFKEVDDRAHYTISLPPLDPFETDALCEKFADSVLAYRVHLGGNATNQLTTARVFKTTEEDGTIRLSIAQPDDPEYSGDPVEADLS